MKAGEAGDTYQLWDALIDQALWEGHVYRLYHKTKLAVRAVGGRLQLLQRCVEVVVGLTRHIQVLQREVQSMSGNTPVSLGQGSCVYASLPWGNLVRSQGGRVSQTIELWVFVCI